MEKVGAKIMLGQVRFAYRNLHRSLLGPHSFCAEEAKDIEALAWQNPWAH